MVRKAPKSHRTETAPSAGAESRVIVQRLFHDVINPNRLHEADKYVAPEFIDHTPMPGIVDGVKGFQQVFSRFHSAFPDFQARIEDIVAAPDRAACRIVFEGTHKGEFLGATPTGKRVCVPGINILKIKNGKITDRWGQLDTIGLLQDVGLMERKRPAHTDTEGPQAGKPMKPAEATALVRRCIEEAFNRQDGAVASELIDPAWVDHDPNFPAPGKGPDAFMKTCAMYHAAFRGARMDIEDMFAEGDKVAVRWTGLGTHTGDFMGVGPTGNTIHIPGISIMRVGGGKILDEWEHFDLLGLMKQIGIEIPL